MQNKKFNLGGEQSGHIILGKFATTGDGLLVALEVIQALNKKIKASNFFDVFEMHYYNKTGFNFYLVKREENKVVDILDRWRCKREVIKTFTKQRKNRKSYV